MYVCTHMYTVSRHLWFYSPMQMVTVCFWNIITATEASHSWFCSPQCYSFRSNRREDSGRCQWLRHGKIMAVSRRSSEWSWQTLFWNDSFGFFVGASSTCYEDYEGGCTMGISSCCQASCLNFPQPVRLFVQTKHLSDSWRYGGAKNRRIGIVSLWTVLSDFIWRYLNHFFGTSHPKLNKKRNRKVEASQGWSPGRPSFMQLFRMMTKYAAFEHLVSVNVS